jgi:hypothetical protein
VVAIVTLNFLLPDAGGAYANAVKSQVVAATGRAACVAMSALYCSDVWMGFTVRQQFEINFFQAQHVYLVVGYHLTESFLIALHYTEPDVIIDMNFTYTNKLFGEVVEAIGRKGCYLFYQLKRVHCRYIGQRFQPVYY